MKNFIILDTETTNSIDCPLMYDIGWTVWNANTDEILTTKSFVVAEIFLDEKLMESAYFIEKVPQYWKDIKNGTRKLKRLYNIRKELASDMKKYNTKIVVAHNASFDYRATATTQRYLTSSKFRYFLPYGTEIWCTLKMSRKALKYNTDYDNFCYENNYITKRGCKRYTAEIIYRFIINDNEFKESHTGLEDTLIEKEILKFCLNNNIENGKLWD